MGKLFENMKEQKWTFEKVIKIIYRTSLIIIGLFSMYYMFFVRLSIKDNYMMWYFTVQSNWWVIILEIVLLVFAIIEIVYKRNINSSILLTIKYIITGSIMITFLVYNFVLLPQIRTTYPDYQLTFDTIMMHYVIPIMMLGDFIFLDRKRVLQWSTSFLILVMPVYYLIYTFIRANNGLPFPDAEGELSSRFPYFFLDVDKIGWFGNANGIGVIPWLLIIFIAIVILGFILYGIDTLIGFFNFGRNKE